MKLADKLEMDHDLDCVSPEHSCTCTSPMRKEAAARIRELEAVLRELVRLKDIHDKLDCSAEQITGAEFISLRDDYSGKKPKAWDAARAALIEAKQ